MISYGYTGESGVSGTVVWTARQRHEHLPDGYGLVAKLHVYTLDTKQTAPGSGCTRTTVGAVPFVLVPLGTAGSELPAAHRTRKMPHHCGAHGGNSIQHNYMGPLVWTARAYHRLHTDSW